MAYAKLKAEIEQANKGEVVYICGKSAADETFTIVLCQNGQRDVTELENLEIISTERLLLIINN